MSHLAAVVSRSPETEAVSPRTLNLNPFKPSGEAVIGHEYFVFSLLLDFIGHLCLWEPRVERVASVMSRHGILFSLCFNLFWVPPKCKTCNAPRLKSLHKVADTCELHCWEFNVNVSAAPCIISSGSPVRPWRRGYYTVWLSTDEQQGYCPLINGAVSLSDSCPLWPTKNSSQSADRLPSFSSFPLIDLID